MNKAMNFFTKIHSELILAIFLFYLFLQNLNDFIIYVYALNFALMGIGPFTLLVVFLLSPLLLLIFKKKFPLIAMNITIGLFLLARILLLFIPDILNYIGYENPIVILSFISGVGISSFGVFFPAYISQQKQFENNSNAIVLTQSFGIAIGLQIAFQIIGNSWDIATFGLGRIISGVIVLAIILMLPGFAAKEKSMEEEISSELSVDNEDTDDEITNQKKPAKFGRIFVLSLGIYGIISIIWFVLGYPAAFARWSSSSYLIVSIISLGSFMVFLLILTIFPNIFNGMKIWILTILNVILIVSLIMTSALPETQYDLVQIIFTYITAGLSPIVLIDFLLFTQELNKHKPTARKLGGTFGISSVLFLIITFAMVSSFNYEWVPGMFIFRDRFYLLMILVALMILIPLIFALGTKGFIQKAFKDLPKKIHLKNKIVALSLIGIFIGISAIGMGVFTINPPTAPSSPTTFKIMTYNVHQGEDKSGQLNLDRILASVKRIDPDILSLQEAETARICFGNIDLVRYLAENLNMYYYYGPKTITGTYGVAILSKYPIEFTETYFMPSGSHSQRVIIRLDIRIGSELVHIYNTHFGLEHEERTPQAIFVRDLVPNSTRTFIMGDFNTKDNETEYPIYTTKFIDSWLDMYPSGNNGTWNGDTNRFPRRRIDYILFTTHSTLLSVEVLTWAIESDHWPVFAEFQL
ncbi:MAG: endonuclease/exonuclease/phosphatase family protein [Candidatus Thorarchaeota archaeon]